MGTTEQRDATVSTFMNGAEMGSKTALQTRVAFGTALLAAVVLIYSLIGKQSSPAAVAPLVLPPVSAVEVGPDDWGPPISAQAVLPQYKPTDPITLEQGLEEYRANCPGGLPYFDGSDFKLVEKLSERRFHKVFVAFHKTTRRVVVLRFLTRPSFVVREVRVAARLCKQCNAEWYNIPVGLVQPHEWVFESRGFKAGPAMMYPHLGTHKPLTDALEPLRQDGRMPPQMVHQIAKQLLESVSCMHAQGVMHRDIKQSNILATVTPRLVLTIIDFGSAELVKPGAIHSVLVGTMQFKPAELLLGLKEYAHFLDMWELAVTFSNMVFNAPPGDSLFNPRLQLGSNTGKMHSMDASSERRLSSDKLTQQKHLNMLEQIAILLGSDCIAKDVKTYAGSMQVQQAKAFKTDGQDGLDILLRKLKLDDSAGRHTQFTDAMWKRFADLEDPVTEQLITSMLICDPELRPSASESLKKLNKLMIDMKANQASTTHP